MSAEITVKVNGENEFTIAQSKEGYLIDGQSIQPDIQPLGNDRYSILHKHKMYSLNIIGRSDDGKQLQVEVNGERFLLDLKDRYDRLLDQLGMKFTSSAKLSEIRSPMPGLILSVLVEPGQSVKEGDTLFILEAMKMENVIKSPGDAVVSAVHCEQGQAVEKRDLIISFE